MGNMTLSMPEEVLVKMNRFREIRWSEIARQAIQRKIEDLEMIEQIASKSKLTKKDVEEFSKKINSHANKRFIDENNS